MSYITKEKDSMNKGEKNLITINKAMFAFASTFADPYFADPLNWRKLAIHFKHETSNQRKIITLMEESNAAPFEMSDMARTGNWQVEKIQVFDKDGDMVEVPRSDMPSPSSFDFSTVRRIAPSEAIVAINEGPQRVILGSTKGALYEPGFKVRLWNDTLLNYHDANIYTINSIVGDSLELDQVIANYTSGDSSIYSNSGTQYGGQPMPEFMFLQGSTYTLPMLVENQQYNITLTLSIPSIQPGQTNDIQWYIRLLDSNDNVISNSIGSGDTLSENYNNYSFTDSFIIGTGGLTGVTSVVFGLFSGSINDGSLPLNFNIDVSAAGAGGLKPLRLKFPNFSDASPKQKGIYQFIGSTF